MCMCGRMSLKSLSELLLVCVVVVLYHHCYNHEPSLLPGSHKRLPAKSPQHCMSGSYSVLAEGRTQVN